MRPSDKKFLRKSILFTVTLIGVVLVWRGVWEISNKFFNPETSLLAGFVILIIVGLFFRKFLMRNLL